MNFTNNILQYLKNIGLQNNSTASEEVCPNCWGRQEYEGHYYKPLKAKNFNDEIQKKDGSNPMLSSI
ncbi:hypothetical protein RBH94_08510 [Aestuariibaculum sp. YM273]|uniref:hypothetical protein n=1 Tax=Aestuariibaculum sp. YM273 TaxID=3070659 RepID=UPI0027DD7878|nr:hypothetical protein [Aestuariibaculum sp. YM273]WMI64112.1 hypothetical protein RBH94_08510 [Aestuariibaculum sp. YM273]